MRGFSRLGIYQVAGDYEEVGRCDRDIFHHSYARDTIYGLAIRRKRDAIYKTERI